jgi:hypothetical protein
MRVITARILDEMFEKIREIEESEKIDRAEATRKLLSVGIMEIKKGKSVRVPKGT